MASQTDELVKRITDELSRANDLNAAVRNVADGLNNIMLGLADQL
jgi:hypothetical protein